jgi:CheY-like chemotaxis protein
MHGGSITARSEGPGCGAEFTVRLPLFRAQAAANDDIAPQGAGAHGEVSRPLAVLVVDDNCDSADSMAMLLRMKGVGVHVAYNGKQALALIAESFGEVRTVDIALVDIAMPGADGFTVMRELRKTPALAGALFAAMTGFGQESDIEHSLAQGFDVHLTKPVQLPLIDALLDRARERRDGGATIQ